MKNKILLLGASFFIFSCIGKMAQGQPEILAQNSGFDLEKITFDEDPTALFSKNLADDENIRIDSITPKTFSDTIFKYKIENYLAEEFKLKVPKTDFGFLYKTPQLDSVAKLNTAYCERLWMLTDTNKKPVAYYAEARFNTKKEKDTFIKNLKEILGATKYEFLIDSHFNQCSYEWEFQNKVIQIETSKGVEMSVSTDKPFSTGEYYRIDILIIKSSAKEAIYKAHELILPDKFNIKGKIDANITYTQLKELNLEKINYIKDEFLLNSYNKEYVNDEYGIYRIREED